MKDVFNFKVALVHDWLINFAGSERALEAIYETFPGDIHTLIKNRKAVEKSGLKKAKIFQSFIHKMPLAKRYYQWYLPLFPIAVEHMNLGKYDVILSSSHCVAKGGLIAPEQLHICYCYTPIRYAWDLYHDYLQGSNLRSGVKGVFAKTFLHYLRNWDLLSAKRVDCFVAISHFIKKRIERIYGQSAEVIHPPVDVEKFKPAKKREDYYITMSRLVPYKRIDLIVEAFSKMPEKKLIVIGDGPEMKKIKKLATKNVEILGHQPFDKMRDQLQKAKAFVFAALEDFGIAPVEAMAAGCPVIAFGKGGILDSVVDGKSGLFFDTQSAAAICKSVQEFEKKQDRFDPLQIAKNVQRFNKKRFQDEFSQLVKNKAEAFFQR